MNKCSSKQQQLPQDIQWQQQNTLQQTAAIVALDVYIYIYIYIIYVAAMTAETQRQMPMAALHAIAAVASSSGKQQHMQQLETMQ